MCNSVISLSQSWCPLCPTMLSLLTLALQADEQPNFTQYCVYVEPILRVEPNCNAEFTPEIGAILNVSLELNKTGWMFLDAQANTELAPKVQMKAIGYAEGYLFHEHIANHQANLKEYFLTNYLGNISDYPSELYQFYIDNMAWTKQQSQKNRDAYWKQVAYTMSHFDGLVLGYQQACSTDTFLSELELFIYMSSGDLLDVVEFAIPETRYISLDPNLDELNDHCSGLVRITEEEAYVSQVAWFTYGSMTRVSKRFRFNLGVQTTDIKFSSYPGFSYSFDDWYQANNGMMYFETTSSVYDTSLYELCSAKALMTWIRAPVAGRLAVDVEDFAVQITKYNSGTYNNQWVGFDSRKFEQHATDGLLWIQEQLPGKSAAYDATERLLEDGYFPSYNSPSMLELRIIAGYPGVAATNRSKDYYGCARAQIFARDAPEVSNLDQMIALMRYNDYLNDPLAWEDATQSQEPADAIASRYDLRIDSRIKCFGAFDAKVGRFNRITGEYDNHFISSPAYDDVPAWEFPESDVLFCPRRGLPDGPYVHEFVHDSMGRT